MCQFGPDAHGCVGCPHTGKGMAIQASTNVFINKLPAFRKGDLGVHMPCCGPNLWTAAVGSGTVFINNKPAHRVGDMQQHCGGVGTMASGSPNVIIGG